MNLLIFMLICYLFPWTRTRTRTRTFWTRNSLDPSPEKNYSIGRTNVTKEKKENIGSKYEIFRKQMYKLN